LIRDTATGVDGPHVFTLNAIDTTGVLRTRHLAELAV
jgi:hypothetical protein